MSATVAELNRLNSEYLKLVLLFYGTQGVLLDNSGLDAVCLQIFFLC